MFGYKLCPKCDGDLFADRDLDEWIIICLQCGHRTYIGQMASYDDAKALIHSLYALRRNCPQETELKAPDRIAVPV